MSEARNALGQPIGASLPDWIPVSRPPGTPMEGHYCRVEPIDVEAHSRDLFEAFAADEEGRNWTYLPYGPFEAEADVREWIVRTCLGDDPCFHAIVDKNSGKTAGVASLLRIQPTVGVIEVGHINYAPCLQKTPAATEAMFLLMRRVFSELGYRRYEWKCDALNSASRRAAERLGFSYDGLFRQATIYKGRNRDTAWYSILDKDWPFLKAAYEAWLASANFDDTGLQKQSLRELIAAG